MNRITETITMKCVELQNRRIESKAAPRLKQLGKIMLLASTILVTALDITDTKVDVCVYTVDGSKQNILEIAESLDFAVEGINSVVVGECMPSIQRQ